MASKKGWSSSVDHYGLWVSSPKFKVYIDTGDNMSGIGKHPMKYLLIIMLPLSDMWL